MYYVYMVQCADNTLYTGITTDLIRRVSEHNAAIRGAKYTQGRRPVTLVYSIKVASKSLALREEYRIKQLTRKGKLQLLPN